MESVPVPRYLHLPIQILWFDMEDIAVFIVSYVLAMAMSSIYVLPFCIALPVLFMRVKSRRPRGFLRHLLYQYGFQKLEGYPPAMTSRFEE